MEKAMKFAAAVFSLAVVLCVFSYGKEDDTKNAEQNSTSVAEESAVLSKNNSEERKEEKTSVAQFEVEGTIYEVEK